MKLIKKLFSRQKPQYGQKIFAHRTWIERQVDDALWKQSQQRVFKSK